MAKTPPLPAAQPAGPTAPPPAPAPPPSTPAVPARFATSLEEACRALSRRHAPEAVSAFYGVEKRAGRLRDTEAAYGARFDAFMQTPA
ncbi:hypothetical protein [Methylomagnum ishizawai]|uniref:hypothetical protein n=1 Tax=Methylomagnum ishizawai TaxID=1760988 RepID=UPI001C8048C8|nr:hypothetical protein [Methylomagnum ishizawai]